MRSILLACLLALVVAFPAEAQPPPTHNVMAARHSPVGRVILPNGLVVLVSESPGEDIVALEVLVRVGLTDESNQNSGITHLILRILRDRISNDNGEDVIEVTGSVLNTSSEPDYARISLVTTSAQFPRMLGRISAAMRSTTFTEAEVSEAKDEILGQLRGDQGAFTQLYDIFCQNFYRYHPYKNNQHGTESSVSRTDAATVSKFFKEHFASNRTVVSVAGRVNRSLVTDMARREFAALKPVELKTLDIAWEPKASEKEIFLSANSSIAWVFLGYPAPNVSSRDYVAMKLIHALMGDGLSSRLFTEIREKRGLAYELGAVYPTLLGPSHMLTYTITRPNQVGAARSQIFREIDRLKEHGVGSSELDASRRKLIGNYLLERETNTGRAYHLAIAEVIGVGYEFDVNFIKNVESVTPTEIQQVAKRYLDNYTLVVARPGGRFYFDF